MIDSSAPISSALSRMMRKAVLSVSCFLGYVKATAVIDDLHPKAVTQKLHFHDRTINFGVLEYIVKCFLDNAVDSDFLAAFKRLSSPWTTNSTWKLLSLRRRSNILERAGIKPDHPRPEAGD